MNQEVMMIKGQLASEKADAGRLEMEIQGLISLLRLKCPAVIRDMTQLPVHDIKVHADELLVKVSKLKDIKAFIKQLEDSLG